MALKRKKILKQVQDDRSGVGRQSVMLNSFQHQNDKRAEKCAVLADEVDFAKAELNYFKGLSIFLTTLLVVIFFAFGSLFGLMYLETREIALQVDDAVSNLQNGGEACDYLCGADAEGAGKSASTISGEVLPLAADLTKWINFEKYGFEAWFPNTWSYLDRPYQKQVHLFVDGKVREVLGSEWGDVTVAFVKNDAYKDKYEKSVIDIAGTYGFKYAVAKVTNESDVVIVPVDGGYIELHIYKIQNGKTVIASDIIDTMIAQFRLK